MTPCSLHTARPPRSAGSHCSDVTASGVRRPGECLEKTVIQGCIEGSRPRGRPARSWINDILEATNCTLKGWLDWGQLGPRFCNFVLAHEVLQPRVAAACRKLCRHRVILSCELSRKLSSAYARSEKMCPPTSKRGSIIWASRPYDPKSNMWLHRTDLVQNSTFPDTRGCAESA